MNLDYPKKSWCLYLKGVINKFGEDLTTYDGCIGYEKLRENDDVIIQITDKLGYRKDPIPDNKLISVPISELKLGFISKYHLDYLQNSIKKIQSKYLKDDASYWLVYSTFGYNEFLDILLKNNGILDDKTVEEVASNSKIIWSLLKVNSGYLLRLHGTGRNFTTDEEVEVISSIEALKRYGLDLLENVMEKTSSFISFQYERERKLSVII